MFELKAGGLQHQAVISLLQDHLAQMAVTSPPESCHALDLTSLMQPEISFWTLWQSDQLAGCVALKQIAATHGEIKSMKTAAEFTRQGVATELLRQVIDEAQKRRYHRLSLETGSMSYFGAARCLYERFGFTYCAPFADYVRDPNNVFMTLSLQQTELS